MEHFAQIFKGASPAIVERISASNKEKAAKNNEAFLWLIEIIRNCVEKGSALRGHRDDGVPSITNDRYVNIGNFKAEVVSRSVFDPTLKEHLEPCSESTHATYLSKYAQADFISCILKHLQSVTITEARNQSGKFIFAVSADEVTDCSNVEQLAIVIKSVGIGGVIN